MEYGKEIERELEARKAEERLAARRWKEIDVQSSSRCRDALALLELEGEVALAKFATALELKLDGTSGRPGRSDAGAAAMGYAHALARAGFARIEKWKDRKGALQTKIVFLGRREAS